MKSSDRRQYRCAHPRTAAAAAFALVWMVALPGARGQQPPPKEDASLSLAEAVELALKNNLQAVIAQERMAQVKGEQGIRLSALLPNLSGAASQANLTSNIAAVGLLVAKLPGLSPFTGAFNGFDARFQLVQSVFWRCWR